MEVLDKERHIYSMVRATCKEFFRYQAFYLVSIKMLSKAIALFKNAQSLAIHTLEADILGEPGDISLRRCSHRGKGIKNGCFECREAFGLLLIDHGNFELSGETNDERIHDLLVAVTCYCATQVLKMSTAVLPDCIKTLGDLKRQVGLWGLSHWEEVIMTEQDEQGWKETFLIARLRSVAEDAIGRLATQDMKEISRRIEEDTPLEIAMVANISLYVVRLAGEAREEYEALYRSPCLETPAPTGNPVSMSKNPTEDNPDELLCRVLMSVDKEYFHQTLSEFIGAKFREVTWEFRDRLLALGKLINYQNELLATDHEWKDSPWSGGVWEKAIFGSVARG